MKTVITNSKYKRRGRRLYVNEDILDKYIRHRMQMGVMNASKLFLEVKEKGYKKSYATFNRRINLLKNEVPMGKRKRVTRYETGAGDQAQMDWARFGTIIANGKCEPLSAFVLMMSYSRMKYVEFTIRQNLPALQNCHIHAFETVGIPKEILYDNMKTVVLERDRMRNLEPKYNAKFQKFAKHYGFKIALCHPYWPRDKGKVEAAVKLLRNDFMNGMKFGRDFSSLQELNEKVSRWLASKANKRIHGTTGERPLIRYEKEKKYLRFPSRGKVYETSLWSTRYVTQYGMVRYKYNSYSVPDEFARKKVVLNERSENGMGIVDIYYKNKLIASHELSGGRNMWIQDEKHFKTYTDKGRKTKTRIQRENEKILRKVFNNKPLSYYDRYLL